SLVVAAMTWVLSWLVAPAPICAQTERQAALALIEQLGGRVWHVDGDPRQPVVAISLTNTTETTDEHLLVLRHVPELKRLLLASTITDNGLRLLPKLDHLEQLGLDDTRVTDAGLKE